MNLLAHGRRRTISSTIPACSSKSKYFKRIKTQKDSDYNFCINPPFAYIVHKYNQRKLLIPDIAYSLLYHILSTFHINVIHSSNFNRKLKLEIT